MQRTVDCRNMECPQPVMMTKKALEQGPRKDIEVVVDNEAARKNVSRFLQAKGYTVTVRKDGGAWRVAGALEGCDCPDAEALIADAEAASGNALPEREPCDAAKTLVMLISPVFGSGDDALGIKLMKNFLLTLPELGGSLWRIVILNGGVKLAAHDSPVIEELKSLESEGVSILVCGTCLEHFGLMDKKAVGQTTNMLDVVTSIQLADKVVRV